MSLPRRLVTDLLELAGILLLATGAGLAAAGDIGSASGTLAAGGALFVQSAALEALRPRRRSDARGIEDDS